MSAFDLPELEQILPVDLQQYLRSTGWTFDGEYKHAVSFVRCTPRGDSVGLEVLTDKSLGDYRRRTAEALDVLAAFESRPASQISRDILTPPSDIFRFINHSESVETGLISIDDSIRLREAARDVLLSAAHAAIDRRPFFSKLSMSAAREFLGSCREGQTETGSYAALFVIPIPPQLSDGDFGLNQPFSRVVTMTLMHSLVIAASLAEKGAFSDLLTAYKDGLNANLLEALSRLQPDGHGSYIEIAATWSRARKPPQFPVSRVRFDAPVFRAFGEASREIKSQKPRKKTICGRVRKLERAEHLQKWGRIVVEWDKHQVGIDLEREDYLNAIAAHRNDREVKVTGTLVQIAKASRLTDVADFRVVDPPRTLFDSDEDISS